MIGSLVIVGVPKHFGLKAVRVTGKSIFYLENLCVMSLNWAVTSQKQTETFAA